MSYEKKKMLIDSSDFQMLQHCIDIIFVIMTEVKGPSPTYGIFSEFIFSLRYQ